MAREGLPAEVRAEVAIVRYIRVMPTLSDFSRSRVWFVSVVLAPLTALSAIRAQPALAPNEPLRDSMRIFYVGRAVGWERYDVTPSAGGVQLNSDFDYIDRGRRVHTQATMQLSASYAPIRLEIARITESDRANGAGANNATNGGMPTAQNGQTRTVATRVDISGSHATVLKLGATTGIAIPSNTFALAPASPMAQHLALVRFWRANGEPATISLIPGEPTNPVHITKQGTDTITVFGAREVLTRYALDGIVWGTEYLWLDSQDRLAMFSTAGGGLITKGVRGALLPAYDALMAIGARASVVQLAQIAKHTTATAQSIAAKKGLALVGATLIDGTGNAAIPNATVIVRNGRIVAAGPAATTKIAKSVTRVDVAGKTIIPGLWDMHAHVHQLEWLPTYLATGITSVRDMGNEFTFVTELRRATTMRRAVGPNLFLAGLIDGPGANAFGEFSASTPDEGRAIVRRYAAAGFEQMKLYSLLAPDVVAAICDEAHKQRMMVTGHIPNSLTLIAAIDSGMDQVAHLPIRGDLASDSGKAMIAHFKARGTVFDPTASWGEIGGHASAEPLEHFQPGAPHMPSPFLQFRASGWGSATTDTATAHARLARSLTNIRLLYEAGVPMVAGTDEGVPGFSVYREIELYVQAGMTPMDALRSATSISARAMNSDKDVGTIETGRRADLLVLDANPLDNISNVRTMRWVMKDGLMYDRTVLWNAAGLRP